MKAKEIAEQFEKMDKSLPTIKFKVAHLTWTIQMTQKGELQFSRHNSENDFEYTDYFSLETAIKVKEFLNRYY